MVYLLWKSSVISAVCSSMTDPVIHSLHATQPELLPITEDQRAARKKQKINPNMKVLLLLNSPKKLKSLNQLKNSKRNKDTSEEI